MATIWKGSFLSKLVDSKLCPHIWFAWKQIIKVHMLTISVVASSMHLKIFADKEKCSTSMKEQNMFHQDANNQNIAFSLFRSNHESHQYQLT